MTTRIATLRPGLLVSLKTSVEGGVEYERVDLEQPHEEGGVEKAKWQTTRLIEDRAEFDRAGKARGKARSLIASVCASSDFGLLCPETKAAELEAAIGEAQRIVAEHNATAQRSKIAVYVLKGRIASDDAEALRALSAEVRGLLDGMDSGIRNGDVGAIREAAVKAKRLGAMLSDDAAAKVNAAIEAARAAAKELVKRVEKGGELAEAVVKDLKLDAIQTARFTFLDLDGSGDVAEPGAAVAAPVDLPSQTTLDDAIAAASAPTLEVADDATLTQPTQSTPSHEIPELEV